MTTLGTYRHYKGKNYRLIGIAKREGTLEDMAVYEPLYDCEFKLFTRPLTEFTETVIADGQPVPRFQLISKN